MRRIKTVVIRRSQEEHTVAIVHAEVDDDFADEQANEGDALFAAVSESVTQWCQETAAGRLELQNCGNDFNVGDLCTCCHDPTFVPLLRQRGISRLAVETHADVSGHHWDFDDQLFDELLRQFNL